MEPVESEMYIELNKKLKGLEEKRKNLETQIRTLEEQYNATEDASIQDNIDSMYEERQKIIEAEEAIYDRKAKKLSAEIDYLEKSANSPGVDSESLEIANSILAEKKAELVLLEEEYNEKSEEFVSFVKEDSELKKIRDEIELHYNALVLAQHYIPGFLYTDQAEYDKLDRLMDEYNVTDDDLMAKMAVMENDLLFAAKLQNGYMTQPEYLFYSKLGKIVLEMIDAKRNDYVYSDIAKAEQLMEEFKNLKTKNPYIVDMMYLITKDIKKVKEKAEGKEAADAYQDTLNEAGVGSVMHDTPTAEEIQKRIEDLNNPETFGKKGTRNATEEEKKATKDARKKIFGKTVVAANVAAWIAVAFFSPVVQIVGIAVAAAYLASKGLNFISGKINLKETLSGIKETFSKAFPNIKEKFETRKERRTKIKEIKNERNRILKETIAKAKEDMRNIRTDEEHTRGGI